MHCHVVVLEGQGSEIHLLSPFSREELKSTKSRSELFFGQLIEPSIGIVPGNISYNKDFLVHVHSQVRDIMLRDEEVIRKAEEQLNGFVFIIDQRSPAAAETSGEHVDKEDIIGIFLVNDHKTDVSKYRPNPDYLLVTEKGVAQFPPAVEEELKKLVQP